MTNEPTKEATIIPAQYREQKGETCEGCAGAWSVGVCESMPDCHADHRGDQTSVVFVEVPPREPTGQA